MPTNQPSNAPDDLPATPDDADTAATVLSDERLDDTPGGGGLGGSAAADPLGGSARATGAAPNAPLPDATIAPSAEREAQLRSLAETREPTPTSR